MKEKKNIDRLFQEKFKDFEASPKDHVWSTIASELQENKKPRVIPIWWYRIAGVAAVLIAAFLIGNFFINQPPQKVVNTNKKETLQPEIRTNDEPFTNQNNNSSSKTNEAVVNSSTKDNPITPNPDKNNLQDETNTTNTGVKANSNRIVNRSSVEKSSSVKNGGLASTSNKEESHLNTSSAEKETSENSALAYQEQAINSKIGSENSAEENSSAIDKTTNSSTSTTDQLAENTSTSEEKISDPKETIEDENTIAEVEEEEINEKTKSLVEVAKEIEEEEKNKDEKENEPQLSKWLIKPNVSPIYYGSLNGSNNIDQSLASNSSESDVTMAYGVNFAYAISDKLKVRSGISKVNMSYNVNNIAYSTDVNAVNLQGVTNNSQTQTVEIMSVNNSQPATFREVNRATIAPTTEGVLNQQLGYLEVPLEVEYALLDKRFGINVIGGASTLFLDDNDISINSENGHLSIGEANNLNSVSFTTNVGLGFDYQLSKKFDVNLEPTFKYQLNTYNNNINDFRPYYFGVYTGFSFKF